MPQCCIEEEELAIFTSGGTGGPRLILVGSALIPEKATSRYRRYQHGNAEKNARIAKVRLAAGLELKDPHRYRVRTCPQPARAPPGGHDRADESVRSKKGNAIFFLHKAGVKFLHFAFGMLYYNPRLRAVGTSSFWLWPEKELLLIHDRL